MAATRQRGGEENKKARILVVDDHPLIRQGLKQLINGQPDMEVIGEAQTSLDALEAASRLAPDLAIVDITLEEASGIDLIRDLKAHSPGLAVLVLSMHDESIYGERALRAGARGYIMKGGSLKEVTAAIRRVLDGEVYLSRAMTDRIMQRMIGGNESCADSLTEILTERELRILELIGEGMGPSQLARMLHLSVKTIETHRTRIKEKLQLENAAALRRFAIQWVRDRGPS